MKRIDKIFWVGFVWFCLVSVAFITVFDLIDFAKLGPTEDGIVVGFLLICGLLIRFWIYKNPEEMKRRFKIDEE